jgi:hypothetical protein
MAAANAAPRPNIAKFLVFLMAFLLMRLRRAASWSYWWNNENRYLAAAGADCGGTVLMY